MRQAGDEALQNLVREGVPALHLPVELRLAKVQVPHLREPAQGGGLPEQQVVRARHQRVHPGVVECTPRPAHLYVVYAGVRAVAPSRDELSSGIVRKALVTI